MKRITSIMLGVIIAVAPVLASEVVEWNSIAPSEYQNATYQKDDTMFKNHRGLAALSAATIVGLPATVISKNKSLKIEENNYWAQRRADFETQRDMCKLLKDDDKRTECFINLRASEIGKTQQRNYEQAQLNVQRQQAVILNNMNTGINNINSNLNYYRYMKY